MTDERQGLDPRCEFNPYEVVIRLRTMPAYTRVEPAVNRVFGLPSLDRLLLSYGAAEVRASRERRPSSRTFTVTFRKPVDIFELVGDVKRDASVEDASPHYIYRLAKAEA